MSIYVIRAFVRMRDALSANETISRRLAEIENTLLTHDAALRELYKTIRPLLMPHYFLRRAPHSAHQHKECTFAVRPIRKALDYYTKDAIHQRPDGTLSISLEPLRGRPRHQLPNQPAKPQSPVKLNRPTKRNRITLLGLLEVLWEQAHLHEYDPEESDRNHGTLINRLLDTAELIHIGRSKLLSDHLFIPSHPNANRDLNQFVTSRTLTALSSDAREPLESRRGSAITLFAQLASRPI